MAKKTNAQAIAEAQSEITAAFGKPRAVDLSVPELLDNIRSCGMATAGTMKKDTKKNREHEMRCYRDLFKQITGRKPTEAEVMHMVGGVELRRV